MVWSIFTWALPSGSWLYTTQLFVSHQVGTEVKSDAHGSSPLFSALSEQWGNSWWSLMVQCYFIAVTVYTILGSQYSILLLRSKMQILVSPNSSLSTKHSMFPWSGLIYIHCDNGQKVLKKKFFFNQYFFCSLNVIILLMALTFQKSNWGPFSPNSLCN